MVGEYAQTYPFAILLHRTNFDLEPDLKPCLSNGHMSLIF